MQIKRNRPQALAGRTAVITGAGSGIGRALAARLSSHGCPVAIADIDAAALRQTETTLSGPVLARVLDVRDAQAQLDFAAEVSAWSAAPLGAVFNNAGVAMSAAVAATEAAEHARVLGVNFDGVVYGTRAFLPALLEQGTGTIVNTSSVFGLFGVPFQAAYCASKFAVRGFTEALRHELRGTGVRAVTVHPGGVKTNIAHNARVLEDPLGEGRTAAELADEFTASIRTTPERAAQIIHRGVDAGKARILVGADAHALDVLTRIAPTGYWSVLEPLALRARGRGPSHTAAAEADALPSSAQLS